MGKSIVDAFVSRLSYQLPQYMSWKLNHYCPHTFTYKFPLFSLIQKALKKPKRTELMRFSLLGFLQPW